MTNLESTPMNNTELIPEGLEPYVRVRDRYVETMDQIPAIGMRAVLNTLIDEYRENPPATHDEHGGPTTEWADFVDMARY